MASPRLLRGILGAAVVAVLVAVATHTRADPDLFGNIRFGQDVVESRSAQVDDRYSFASERRFVNHEWLFQAIAFLAFRAGGAAGIVALKLALLAAMLAAVLVAITSAKVHGPPALLLAGLVVVATFPQTNQVRAQLCSLALFAWLLVALVSARRRAAALVLFAPIMMLWVNLHGGWIVGVGTLALWHVVGLLRDGTRRRALVGLAATAAACAATLVNPFGWRLWTFLRDTVGFERVEIADWQPVFRLGLGYGALWAMVAALALAATIRALRRRELDLQATAVVLLFAVASFRVNRLLAFFAIAAVTLLAADLAALVAMTAAPKTDRPPSRLAAGVAAVIGFVLIFGGGATAAANLACIRMEDGLFAEPQVATLVARYGLHGRMLTWFDYGHYAIWYFSPQIKVSMDGRRETVYSSDMIQRQLRFYYRPDERQALLDDLKPDYIWLPRTVAVVDPLLADGWKPLFEGPQSLVLSRLSLPDAPIEMTSAGSRCFPGP